jgi:hypothetical protein
MIKNNVVAMADAHRVYKLVLAWPAHDRVDAIDRLLSAIAGLGLKAANDLVSGDPVRLTPSQAEAARAALVELIGGYPVALVEMPGVKMLGADPELDAAYRFIFERSNIADVLCRVHDGIERLKSDNVFNLDAEWCRLIIMQLFVALEDMSNARENLPEPLGSDD